jgi:hypothetical protein
VLLAAQFLQPGVKGGEGKSVHDLDALHALWGGVSDDKRRGSGDPERRLLKVLLDCGEVSLAV